MMKPIKRWNSEFFLAIALLVVVAAITYLPLVSQLGYYHDDWFTVASKVGGVSLGDMHWVDRPVMGKIYGITYQLLGDPPIHWHLFAFAVRLAGILAVFFLLRLIWPQRRLLTTGMALLFTVYPGFLLQPNANNYSNHLIALALAMGSLLLTALVFSFRNIFVRGGLAVASAALVLLYARIYETMIGLEGLRLVLIWYLANRPGDCLPGFRQIGKQIRRTLLNWIPYALTFGWVVYDRLFIFKSDRPATNAEALLGKYSSQPLDMVGRIVIETGKDVIESVFFAWAVPAYRLFSEAKNLDMIIAVVLALVCAGLIWIYARRMGLIEVERGQVEHFPFWDVLLIGELGVVITLLPVDLANRDVRFAYNLDRYTIQSILAISIFLGGLIFAWLKPALRLPVLAIMVGLGVMTQYTNAAFYRDFWASQRQFWWQVTWRAPGIQRETVLVAVMPPGYRDAEDFEIWAPADLIYYPQPGDMIGLTAQVLNTDTFDEIAGGKDVFRSFRQIPYIRRYNKALLLSMPTSQSCVHVINPAQVELSSAEDFMVRAAAPFSHPGQINLTAQPVTPPASVFGQEPARTWCYYYQKADLARQQGNWTEAARLGDEAQDKGYAPTLASEWIPFYEAYFNTGQADKAARVMTEIKKDATTWQEFCVPFNSGPGAQKANPAVTELCKP